MKRQSFGDTDAYVEALREALAECPPIVEELLRIHYEAPRHVRTYSQLAAAVGYRSYGGVSLQYGRLARKVADRLGVVTRPEEGFWGIVIVDWFGVYDPCGTRFRLRPVVIKALEQLGLPWTAQSRSNTRWSRRRRRNASAAAQR